MATETKLTVPTDLMMRIRRLREEQAMESSETDVIVTALCLGLEELETTARLRG